MWHLIRVYIVCKDKKNTMSFLNYNLTPLDMSCMYPGIFIRGGQGPTDRKMLRCLFLFVCSVLYLFCRRGLRAISKKTIIRLIFQGPWGSNFFPDGGVQSLIPIETYIELVIFQRGSRLSGSKGGLNPLDPHIYVQWPVPCLLYQTRRKNP